MDATSQHFYYSVMFWFPNVKVNSIKDPNSYIPLFDKDVRNKFSKKTETNVSLQVEEDNE